MSVGKYCAGCGRGLTSREETAIHKKLHYHVGCYFEMSKVQYIAAEKLALEAPTLKQKEKAVSEMEDLAARISMINQPSSVMVGRRSVVGS